MNIITEAQRRTWNDHLIDYNNPHQETAKQVGAIRVYLSLEELNKTNTSSLTEIAEAMDIPSELSCSIDVQDTTIYPALKGELIIHKSALDTGNVIFVAQNGEVFTSIFKPTLVALETSSGDIFTTSSSEEIYAQI